MGCTAWRSHFMAVGEDNLLDTQPFLAASRLLAEGYGFGGEGDVTSAAAVAMMVALAARPTSPRCSAWTSPATLR